jgi:septal ring factor EnvC (AmiA/AmiB activator)
MLMKNKKIFICVLTGACFAMAMTMPSCPGQQAMQQQIDALQASNQELTTKVHALEAQEKVHAEKAPERKKAMEDMAAAIAAQKTALDNLNATVQQMQTKLASMPAKPAAKTASKPAAKHRH